MIETKKSEEKKVRGSLKSDLMLPENAADKTCKDNIWYKITGLFSRDQKFTFLPSLFLIETVCQPWKIIFDLMIRLEMSQYLVTNLSTVKI